MKKHSNGNWIWGSAILFLYLLFGAAVPAAQGQEQALKAIPFLTEKPTIDGDLSEWKDVAFTDGVWDLERVKKASWYHSKRNRLIVHEHEDTSAVDLSATYYIAWDRHYLYFGAAVKDNRNDVMDAKHEPKRWYYKDAIAWFIEAPKDSIEESFGEGDHAFCFVIDPERPDYGAWWRHGSKTETYIEEPLPTEAVRYALTMNPWNRSEADYILEARVKLKATFGKGEKRWKKRLFQNNCGMMIVHCDPDGAEYGGHLLIYGKGDKDSSWGAIRLIR